MNFGHSQMIDAISVMRSRKPSSLVPTGVRSFQTILHFDGSVSVRSTMSIGRSFPTSLASVSISMASPSAPA